MRLLSNVAMTFESRSVQFEIHASGASAGNSDGCYDEIPNDVELWLSALSIFTAWPLASVTLILGDGNGREEECRANETKEERDYYDKQRKLIFLRRHALRLEALSERFGLTDAAGGKMYHSLRIRTPKEARSGKKGELEVMHGDFVCETTPVLVYDRELAQQSIGRILGTLHREGPTLLDGLYEVGGGGVSLSDRRGKIYKDHCGAIQNLTQNRGWTIAGFRTMFQRYYDMKCYE